MKFWAMLLGWFGWKLIEDDGPAAVPIPARPLTERDVAVLADQVGVSPRVLIMAIVAGCESWEGKTPASETKLIMHTMLNRERFAYWGASMFHIAIGHKHRTTGPQGARPYATTPHASRLPQGERLLRMIAIVEDAMAEQAAGYFADGITHFHHLTGSAAYKRNAAWANKGYVVRPFAGAPAATFLAPTANKVTWLRANRVPGMVA